MEKYLESWHDGNQWHIDTMVSYGSTSTYSCILTPVSADIKRLFKQKCSLDPRYDSENFRLIKQISEDEFVCLVAPRSMPENYLFSHRKLFPADVSHWEPYTKELFQWPFFTRDACGVPAVYELTNDLIEFRSYSVRYLYSIERREIYNFGLSSLLINPTTNVLEFRGCINADFDPDTFELVMVHTFHDYPVLNITSLTDVVRLINH